MSKRMERRSDGGQRLPFEALVVIHDAPDADSAYECEAMDISWTGMHFRTAYLPEVGQTLTCTFDIGLGEVILTGEVAWVEKAGRAGEFGIQFSDIDPSSDATLEELCGPPPGELGPPEPEPAPVKVAKPRAERKSAQAKAVAKATSRKRPELKQEAKEPVAEPDVEAEEDAAAEEPAEAQAARTNLKAGSRVRLHLKGLGSPMRARVRRLEDGRLAVGSNLDFLKLGRLLQVEDVDGEEKHKAQIARVGVEVDSKTMIPQLIVKMSFGDDAEVPLEGAVGSEKSAPKTVRAPDRARPTSRTEKRRKKAVVAAREAEPETDEEEDSPAAKDIWKEKAATAAKQVGAGWTSFSTKAKGAWGSFSKQVAEKRKAAAKAKSEKASSEESDETEARPRRRTTSPAPRVRTSGGRSQLRGQHRRSQKRVEEPEEETTNESSKSKGFVMPKIPPKALAAIGGIAALLLIVGLVMGKGGSKSADEKAENGAAAKASAGALSPAGGAPKALGAGANNGDAVMANVPLFGATPLSTTEAAKPPAGLAGPSLKPPVLGSDGDEEEGVGSGEESDKSAGLSKSYGEGRVRNAKILKLKMNRKIKGISGHIEGKRTLVISLLGLKNVESASRLRRKDSKRIKAVKAIQTDEGTEVKVFFKHRVPAFRAHFKRKVLIIDVGRGSRNTPEDDDSGEEKVAKRSKRKSRKRTAHKSKRSRRKKHSRRSRKKRRHRKKRH